MALRFPDSMDECIYFTRRKDDDSYIIAWVFKKQCPKCKKGPMAKPKAPKTGRPKIRAAEYVCDKCGYSEEKKVHEESQQEGVAEKTPESLEEQAGDMPTGPINPPEFIVPVVTIPSLSS